MNFLTQIYTEIETEFAMNSAVQKSHKAALYTLVNYIEAYDKGTGIQQKDIEERFLHKKEYATVFQKLVNNSVIETSSETGNYKLNSDAKQFISPLLENLMNMVYKPEKKISTNDPSLNLLYNCRSQLFSS